MHKDITINVTEFSDAVDERIFERFVFKACSGLISYILQRCIGI